jgi:hypothetical protein
MWLHRYLYFTLSAFCLLLVLSGLARAELPIATGEHWTTATEREKKALLLGMGTIIKIEHEIQGKNPPPDDKTFIQLLVKGMSKYTITSAMEAIDAWYAANPDQLKRPVIEVIWFELTLPNAS